MATDFFIKLYAMDSSRMDLHTGISFSCVDQARLHTLTASLLIDEIRRLFGLESKQSPWVEWSSCRFLPEMLEYNLPFSVGLDSI